MTATTFQPPTAPAPVWRMAVSSFLPRERREGAQSWIARLPLGFVLLVQTLASLRLNNTAFQDEALYLTAGHWIRSGQPVYTHPETFFSGAPQLYPVFGSYLDSIGGLAVTRAFSTLCMLTATVAVYTLGNALFGHRYPRAGLLGAAVFSLSAPVMFLGHFATFDAPSFTLISWAAALAAWSSRNGRSALWSLPIGGFLALAVMLKYSSGIDVPFALLLTLTGWSIRRYRARVVALGLLSGLVTASVLVGSVMTWAHSDLKGLAFTTLHRSLGGRTPAATLGHMVMSWSGASIVLMLVGGLWLFRRQPVIATVLLLGTVAATGYQIHMGEATSLHKHIVLGLIFGAPLAGVMLAGITGRWGLLGSIGVAVVIWVTFMFGLDSSANLFKVWPNTQGLSQTLAYSVRALPTIHMLGDIPEPLEYSMPRTQHWQWTATYEGSFTYKNLTGLPAYETALKDNYFQLAFFDYTMPIGRTLSAEMTKFGFKKTGVVSTPFYAHTWVIWQRYDSIPK